LILRTITKPSPLELMHLGTGLAAKFLTSALRKPTLGEGNAVPHYSLTVVTITLFDQELKTTLSVTVILTMVFR